jgi:hypothetical protein
VNLPHGRRRQIVIRTGLFGDRSRRVEAMVYGELAIHRSWINGRWSRTEFNVSHVRTGRAIVQWLGLRDARRLVKMLLAKQLNWRFDTIDKIPKRTLKLGKRIRDEFMSVREAVTP